MMEVVCGVDYACSVPMIGADSSNSRLVLRLKSLIHFSQTRKGGSIVLSVFVIPSTYKIATTTSTTTLFYPRIYILDCIHYDYARAHSFS